MKTFYQRNLPHILPPGETIFFTFRLAGSLPVAVLRQLQAEQELLRNQADLLPANEQKEFLHQTRKKHFAKFDTLLDAGRFGPDWLRQPAVAQVLVHEIRQLPAEVVCYCIMPNHVHLVCTLPPAMAAAPSKMMQALKGRTAMQVNRLLGQTGTTFWQPESYDHVVRDGKELQRVVAYVLENPVKAGLAADWQEWPYSYWAL